MAWARALSVLAIGAMVSLISPCADLASSGLAAEPLHYSCKPVTTGGDATFLLNVCMAVRAHDFTTTGDLLIRGDNRSVSAVTVSGRCNTAYRPAREFSLSTIETGTFSLRAPANALSDDYVFEPSMPGEDVRSWVTFSRESCSWTVSRDDPPSSPSRGEPLLCASSFNPVTQRYSSSCPGGNGGSGSSQPRNTAQHPPVAPDSCIEIVDVRRVSSACDFKDGVPMYRTRMHVAQRQGMDCPAEIEAEYTDPSDGKLSRHTLGRGMSTIDTCNGGIVGAHVAPTR